MEEKPGGADGALIVAASLTFYKWRKILDVNIWPQGHLLETLFIYWRQTSHSGSTRVDFSSPASQTLAERRDSSKPSLNSSHKWVTAFRCATWFPPSFPPDEHPGSARRSVRRHFLLAQFVRWAAGWGRGRSIYTAAREPRQGLALINELTDQRA